MASLSPEQLHAAEGRGDRVIRAGAGAGKTRVLVEMVANDLLAGVPAEQVMVTTFTRRAAGELIERVGLILAARDPARRVDIEQMWLATMDSCFADLLRESALGLGLPPGVRIAQGHELEAQRAACLERARARCSGVLIDLDRALPLPRADLASLVESLFAKAVAAGRDPTTLSAQSALQPRDRTETARKLGELANCLATRPAAALRRDAAALSRGELSAIGSLRWGRLPQNLPLDAEALRRDLADHLAVLADAQAEPGRAALARLMEAYAKERLTLARATGHLGYEDASLLLWQGLEAGLVERRFARIYVDEAQDTNPSQRRIIDALVSEGGERRLIGDENQSIYAFRFADPAGFAALGKQMEARPLRENYRTSPALMVTISAIAGAIKDPPLAPQVTSMLARGTLRLSDPPARAAFVVGRRVRAPHEARAVVPEMESLRTALGLRHGQVAVLCRTNPLAHAYAETLRACGIPALCLRRGGILAAPECRRVLEYLRCLADPDDRDALAIALAGPVADLGSVVASIMADPRGPLDALAVFRPEVAGAIARHRSWVQRLRPADLARRSLEELGYLEACAALPDGGIAERNVLGLVERIEELRDRGLLQIIDDLVTEIDSETDESAPAPPAPDTDAVQVMTMHAAKGLEFPLVVVAGIGQYLRDDPPPARVDGDGRLGVQVRHFDQIAGDATYLGAADAERAQAVAEERRLLYVAMTRAERGLMFVVSATGSGGDPDFRYAAEWMGPILRAGASLPRTGDREIRALGGGQIEVVRLDPGETVASTSDRLQLDEPTRVLGRPEALVPAPTAASFTAISGWRRCGLRRHLERGLALAGADAWLEGGEGHVAFGRTMHAVLRDADWDAPDPEAMVGRFAPDDRARAREQIARLMAHDELRNLLRRSSGALREERFAFAGPPALVGAMDLVIDEGSAATLLDWKTGDDSEQLFSPDHVLQQEIYALAVFSRQNPPEACDCWWVHLAEEPLRIERRTFGLHERAELTDRVVQAIEACDLMPASPAAAGKPEPFCQRCPGVSGLCPGLDVDTDIP